jgi:hypothetical protein
VAVPPAFLAEGMWVYVHELHSYATAAMWIGLGLAAALLLGRTRRDWGWFILVPVGLLAEMLLSLIYAQAS